VEPDDIASRTGFVFDRMGACVTPAMTQAEFGALRALDTEGRFSRETSG
jgi:hypothetical protein